MWYMLMIVIVLMMLSIASGTPGDRLECLMATSIVLAVLCGGFGFCLMQVGAIAEFYTPLYATAALCAFIAATSIALQRKMSHRTVN